MNSRNFVLFVVIRKEDSFKMPERPSTSKPTEANQKPNPKPVSGAKDKEKDQKSGPPSKPVVRNPTPTNTHDRVSDLKNIKHFSNYNVFTANFQIWKIMKM